MAGQPLVNSDGKELSNQEIKDFFKGFQIDEVLLEYDFPRVFSAVSPNNEYWIFKWCDMVRDNGEIWLAFQVSKSQLESLKDGTTSLKDAINLTKNDIFMFLCDGEPFEPIDIKVYESTFIPKAYLPKKDVSFKDGLIRT